MRTFRQILIPLALLLLTFIAYSNTFRSSFQFDDRPHIEENTHIRMTELSWQEITDVFKSSSKTRPVPMLTFALNYYVGRYDVLGYHLVNVLIHGINAVLLYFFLRITLGLLPNPMPHSSWVAFFAALLWLLHPVQTQSVTYIVQRINSMAALFYILSLLLYARGRILQRQRAGSLHDPTGTPRLKARFPSPFLWFGSSVLAGMLAMGCKEISVSLPFFLFLYEWYFFQDLSRPWLRRWLPCVLGACIPIFTLVLLHWGPHPLEKIAEKYSALGYTLSQRVMTELRVVIHYASLLAYPHPSRLNLDYDFPLSHSLFDPPTTLLSLCVIASLVGLACWLAKRKRLLSFCILWFFGNLVIESSVIPLDIVFEHRLYLPSMLAALLIVVGLYRHIRPKQLVTGLLCLTAIVLSVWTYQRNEVWRDPESLWSDTAKKSPNKARPHNNWGEALARQGKFEEAMTHYREAIRVEPDYVFAYNNLGNVFLRQERLEEAIALFREASRIEPGYATAHYNLAIALARQGNVEEAIARYRRAVQVKPEYPTAHYNLGILLAQQGDLEGAITHYQEALRINPEYANVHHNLGTALLDQGKLGQAITHYRQALQIDPDDALAHNSLGIALAREGNLQEAINHYQEALRIRPRFSKAYNNLANAFFIQGMLEEAIAHYREALRIQPDFAEAHYNLANALARQGRLSEAEVHYQEAVRNRPILRNRPMAPATTGKQ